MTPAGKQYLRGATRRCNWRLEPDRTRDRALKRARVLVRLATGWLDVACLTISPPLDLPPPLPAVSPDRLRSRPVDRRCVPRMVVWCCAHVLWARADRLRSVSGADQAQCSRSLPDMIRFWCKDRHGICNISTVRTRTCLKEYTLDGLAGPSSSPLPLVVGLAGPTSSPLPLAHTPVQRQGAPAAGRLLVHFTATSYCARPTYGHEVRITAR